MTRQSTDRPVSDRPAGDATRSHIPGERPLDIRRIPVATIMNSPAIAVRADAPLDIALTTFAVHGARRLVVGDAEGRCVGMLTDRVVTARWAMRPMTFARTRVSQICDGPRPFAAPAATLAEVARVLRHCSTDAVV